MAKSKRYCPYLGLEHDRDTCVSYPAMANTCYRGSKPARVLLEYQENCCLTDTYTSCPVFVGGGKVALPPENREPDVRSRRSLQKWLSYALIILVVSAAGLAGFQYRDYILGYLHRFEQQPVVIGTYIPPTFVVGSAQAEGVYQPGVLSTPVTGTGTPKPVSATPQPTLTATPTGPQIGDGFLIHKILAGESLDRLADQFYTTREAILDINYKLTPPLPEGNTIVIPDGIVKTSKYPQFEVKFIAEKIKVNKIVEKFDCNLTLFQQYNRSIIISSLDVEYILDKQWVLIPRERAAKKTP